MAQLIRTRPGGNPFFAEEIIYALRDSEIISVTQEAGQARCVVNGDLERVMQALPDTVQGVVLSRIDRLQPEEQLALKVAAVIGRTFAYAPLRATLGEHMEISDRLLKAHLEQLVQRELTLLDAPEPELTYVFKHIVTQEVAYETLLFAQRRQLHRTVAHWYEQTFGDQPLAPGQELEAPLAPFYPLLVYHWHQAEDHERERYYARLAGQWAAAHFANAESAGYFSRAIDLTPAADTAARYDLLLAREAVDDLRGAREEQARDLQSVIRVDGRDLAMTAAAAKLPCGMSTTTKPPATTPRRCKRPRVPSDTPQAAAMPWPKPRDSWRGAASCGGRESMTPRTGLWSARWHWLDRRPTDPAKQRRCRRSAMSCSIATITRPRGSIMRTR